MKRSNKGRAYFYAYGQKDKALHGSWLDSTTRAMTYRKGIRWPMWAQAAYQNGWNGY